MAQRVESRSLRSLDPTLCLLSILPSNAFVWCYGAEFTGQMMDLWAYKNEVKIDFSRPGKPTDNAFCESFNGTFRSECLDTNWFSNLEDAKRIIETWSREYNVSRPHRALGERTPSEFASEYAASRVLTAT
jgi:putative transposase